MKKFFFFKSSSTSTNNGKTPPETQCSGLRRSRSLSSATFHGDAGGVLLENNAEPPRLSLTPKKHSKTRKETANTYGLDFSGSSKSSQHSSGNSSYGRSTNYVSNKILDLYIDGEQQQYDKNSKPKSSTSHRNSFSSEYRAGRRPPRAQPIAPTSPTASIHDRPRSSSFRESPHLHLSTRHWTRNEFGPESPQKLAKDVVQRLSRVFPHKPKPAYRDFDPDTPTTVDDIFEGYLDSHPSSNPEDFTRRSGPDGFYLAEKEEEVEIELRREAKEAEERVLIFSEDLDQDSFLRDCHHFSVSELLQTIKNLMEERRNLALDVSGHLRFRIAERETAQEALRLVNVELDSRTRRLEKEMKELQLGLEKELDRRSCEWSIKLENYQSEEHRLRERVSELAEQNVSLQREISAVNGREMDYRGRISQSDTQLKNLSESLQLTTGEKEDLQQTVSELQERVRGAEEDRDCIRRSYKEKEKENKELHRVVTRLQRTCTEQDKTVTGLRQGLSEEIERKGSSEKTLPLMEQARLTGIEQKLRKEVESFRAEVESLRRENINLLARLRDNGGGISTFMLDQELQDRVDYLTNLGMPLFEESSDLCSKLLEYIRKSGHISENDQHPNKNEFDGYFLVESDMKVQSLKRGFENIKRSLEKISSVLHEKCRQEHEEAREHNSQILEDDVEVKLKAETLLTSVLREKLFSKDQEIDQLQTEVATAVRGHDILRSEVQRTLDALSSVSHKMKDFELQMMRKDEKINQLRSDLQECSKELTNTKSILPKVSEERDLMWEEVKQYSEKNMLLNSEVNLMRKKVETLDEDILLKEGQITILKDRLGNKHFDILYSPNDKSMQEFVRNEL
ncbi:hypothetical protein GIB67_035060 [Kingdonia uniflora]|uniref:DUF7653 domain-containing protein n=1 Tax=Kingdonia uniflora TaxID=39325 RepID=A0A7J7L1K2_9MAGN|nr:hypothetical protein GIB67_035060 [Kingdonia uniflora]